MANTFYLIDYENVNSDGLAGCDKLTSTDHIIIFFTKNAMKINMSEIANHGEAELEMIEVPVGKQSTDIHIGSYIGYLSGIYGGKDCSIVVVSKDTDFNNVIKFWKENAGINISRAKQIKAANTKTDPAKNSVSVQPKKDKKDGKATADSVKKATPDQPKKDKKEALLKTDLNNKVMQILSKAGFDSESVGFVASTVAKNYDEKYRKLQIFRTITSKYGQEKGLNIYNLIKKSL